MPRHDGNTRKTRYTKRNKKEGSARKVRKRVSPFTNPVLQVVPTETIAKRLKIDDTSKPTPDDVLNKATCLIRMALEEADTLKPAEAYLHELCYGRRRGVTSAINFLDEPTRRIVRECFVVACLHLGIRGLTAQGSFWYLKTVKHIHISKAG